MLSRYVHFLLSFILAGAAGSLFGAFNVKDDGATGNGETLDTDAINAAISAAHEAGGGTVRFPAGTYASFSIRLKSNIALHLESGATILAAEPPADDGIEGHRIEDLTLSDIVVYYSGGTRAQGERIVEELDTVYPEPSSWGMLPSWGVWARHVTHFQLRDVELYTVAPDQRPAMMLEDVRGVTLDHVKVTPNPAASTLVLKDGANLNVHRSPGLPELEGAPAAVSVVY